VRVSPSTVSTALIGVIVQSLTLDSLPNTKTAPRHTPPMGHHTTYSFTFDMVPDLHAMQHINSVMEHLVWMNINVQDDYELHSHYPDGERAYGGTYPRSVVFYITGNYTDWQPPKNFQVTAFGKKYRPIVEWHDYFMDYPTQPLEADDDADA